MTYIPEYILCEHLPSDYKMSAYGDHTFHFGLGGNRTLVLCYLCKRSISYEMVTQFFKDSSHPSYAPFVHMGIQYR